ncbi:MAG: deoxyribose-phosphate aldolase [Oscillospiraceae bacterium]|nr:deoxyribose-phosphate aldolase [Oscillospiraceae bacterium]
MNIQEILSKVDHTVLSTTATWQDIRALCDDGMQYKTASVCIPALYVRQAAQYVQGKLPVCTVIGFPNGYSTTAAKCFETKDAVENGASEIDMVISVGTLKAGEDDAVRRDIEAVRAACKNQVLKVIIETCLLTEDEKIRMCRIVSDSGADFIKTSTGFSTAGATFDDIRLFKAHCAPHLKIKAAGGISSIADAEEFIRLGADRLGTSRIVKLVKEGKKA